MVIALYGVSIRGTAPRARSEPTLPFNHVPDGIANCRDESRRMASVSSPDAATPVIGCRLQILCPVRRADRSGRYWPGRYRTSSDREAQQVSRSRSAADCYDSAFTGYRDTEKWQSRPPSPHGSIPFPDGR